MDSLKTDLTNAQSQVSSLDSEKAALTKDVTDLKEKHSALEQDRASVVEAKNALDVQLQQANLKLGEAEQQASVLHLNDSSLSVLTVTRQCRLVICAPRLR